MAADSDWRKASARRILVVDDHPLVRLGIATLISAEPDLVVCGEAGTARDALAMIRDIDPDVVIMDLTLPDGNGLDLVKRLTREGARPRVLVCSIHDSSLFADRALAAGARGYIHKQETTAQVVAAIRKVLAGQIYLSADATQLFLQRFTADSQIETGRSLIDDLSDRELEVFALFGQGLTAPQVAERLHLSAKTVDTHRANIKRKLHLGSSTELTRFAVQWVLEQR